MPKLSNPKPAKPAKAAKPTKAKPPAKPGSKPSSQKAQERAVVYPEVDIRLFVRSQSEPITADKAKELLGWEEGSGKADAVLTDRHGYKVRLANNLTNRPYYPGVAEAYMLEILRNKWRFNGETLIVDKHGSVHDGQHRLIGLVLAAQEWLLDGKRPLPKQRWQKYWKTEPCIDGLVVLGIEPSDDVVNTIGTGKPRSLTDVLYRCDWFRDKKPGDREALARIASWACRLVWDRTEAANVSDAPRRPHSEMMDFLGKHLTLLECVKFIHDEASGNELEALLPSKGYAAGLLYLMAASRSDHEAYRGVGNESGMDLTLLDKAQEFWTELIHKGKKLEPLAEALLNIPAEVTGVYSRDLRCGLIVKGWNLFSDGEQVADVTIATRRNDLGQLVIAEHPRIGGVDVEYTDKPAKPEKAEKPAKPPSKKEQAAEAARKGACPKGGEHDWVVDEDEGESFCSKCQEPAG